MKKIPFIILFSFEFIAVVILFAYKQQIWDFISPPTELDKFLRMAGATLTK